MGLLTFLGVCYAMRSRVPVGHFRNISGHLFTWLVCGSFQWRHGLLFTDCIVWDDKDKVVYLGWWSTSSPKLQLFQLSQHSHVISCRLISSSAYFPRNTTFKHRMQLSEGFWDKILHSKLKTQCFSKEEKFFSGGLSLEARHQSSGSRFRHFFVKTTKDSEQPFWNNSIVRPLQTVDLFTKYYCFDWWKSRWFAPDSVDRSW